MVKTGADRAEKFALKHDAYVNMLRAKKMDKSSLEKFQNDLYLHVKLQEYIQTLDLPYGKLGEFTDLANKFLFKGTNVLADLERFEIPLSYFEDLLAFISEIQFLYAKCVYPTSKIKSKAEIQEKSFDDLFPETVEKLIFDDLIFELDAVDPTSCFLCETKICCHNIVNTVSPFLPAPVALGTTLNIKSLMFLSQISNFSVESVSPVNLDISVELEEPPLDWLEGWHYRKYHDINPQAGSGTNYQIPITVHFNAGVDSGQHVYLNSHSRADFGDIRFTTEDGLTLLSYWLERKVDSDLAVFWVKIDADLSSIQQQIYVYYGKADAVYPSLATDLLHGEATFILFDNFKDSIFDTNKWTVTSGSPVEANGYLRVNADDVRSKNLLPIGHRLKCRAIGLNLNGWQIGVRQLNDSEYQVFTSTGTSSRVYACTYDAPTYEANYTTLLEGWRLFELLWFVSGDVGQFSKYNYNDALLISHTSNPPELAPYSRFLSYSANPNLDIDWIFVAKFISPEPAHNAWGTEESA